MLGCIIYQNLNVFHYIFLRWDAILVNLFTRSVIRYVTTSDIKYHTTLNTMYNVVSVTCVILSLAML